MKLCEHGWTWWISTHLGDTMCFTMIVLTLFWFCLDHGDMFSCSLFLRTWQELVTTILSFLEIQNPEKILNLSVYLLSLKTMDFDVKHLKLQKLLVFGMAIGCPGCFLKVWGLSWAKWKLPLKTLDITRKNPAKLRKTPANICKSQNGGERTFSDSRGLGMAPLGSVALSNDMKHLKLLKSLESGNSWFFPREWISRLFRIDALNQNVMFTYCLDTMEVS